MALRLSAFLYSFVLVITSNVSLISGYDDKITINLVNSPVATTIHKEFITLRDCLQEFVLNVPTSSFFVLQVHSNRNQVALSNDTSFDLHSSISGSDVGLVQIVDHRTSYDFYLRNDISDQRALVVVSSYEIDDPVPGGCNMVFDVENAPYQKVSYTEDMIIVDVQAASIPDHFCEENHVQLEMYQYFYDFANFSDDSYFSAIDKMLDARDIRSYATQVPYPEFSSKLRRYYVRYQGQAAVYAVIATHMDRTSVYVPTVSYGSPTRSTEKWYILAALFITSGVLIVALGSYLEPFVTYLILFLMGFTFFQEFPSVTITFQLVIPVVISAILLIPIAKFKVSRFVNYAFVSYILTCDLFFSLIGDCSLFQNVWNYWPVFLTTSLLIWFVVLTGTCLEVLHNMWILFIGWFFFLIGCVYYASDISLSYMILNNFKHLTVKHFSYAVVHHAIMPFSAYVLLVPLVTYYFIKAMCSRRTVENEPVDEESRLNRDFYQEYQSTNSY